MYKFPYISQGRMNIRSPLITKSIPHTCELLEHSYHFLLKAKQKKKKKKKKKTTCFSAVKSQNTGIQFQFQTFLQTVSLNLRVHRTDISPFQFR